VENDNKSGVNLLLRKWINMTEKEKKGMGEKAGKLFERQYETRPAAIRFQKEISSSQGSYS
jgi:hypothetical protein